MNCPNCGAENPQEASFCNLCHARFGEPQQPPVPAPPPEQQLPPGAFTPPAAPGVSPGAYTGPPPGAYDAFGFSPTGALPPIKKVKTMDPTLVWVLRIVVIAVCFAIGWYAADWVLTRPKTFKSPTSGISFTYPGNWKHVTGSGFGIAAAANTGGQMSVETELADGNTETNAAYYLAVGSIKGMTIDFETFKSRVRGATASSITANMPAGSAVTGLTFSDVTVAGSPGLSMKYIASYSGMTFDCDVTFVENGGVLYLFGFQAKKPTGTNGAFQNLLKTVKFKT